MAKRRTGYPTDVDKGLATLTEEGKQSFLTFAHDARTLLELQAWLKERDINVSVSSLSNWRRRTQQANDRAEAVMKIVESSGGVDPRKTLAYCVTTSVLLLQDIQQRLDQEWSKSDLQSAVNVLRELRSASSELAALQVKIDTTESILSGAYEICSRTVNIAKGNPHLEMVEGFLDGAVKSLEQELRSEQLSAMVGG